MQGEDQGAPGGLSVLDLSRGCAEQTERYRQGQPFDDRYCFELLRRAIVGRDADAWAEIMTVYREQVLHWCRTTRAAAALEADDLAALSWEKLWGSYSPDHFARANSSAAVLRYLKLCVHSVALDHARAASSPSRALDEAAYALADPAPTPEGEVSARARHDELWRLVEEHLRDERERVLLTLLYELGLRPAEVTAQRPDLFPTAADVYRVTRNVLERLGRSARLRAWLTGEGN